MFLAGLLWELEDIQVKKTPVFTRKCRKNIEKKQFTVNSGVLDEFCPLCCQNIVNTSVFSSKGTKMPLNIRFLDVLGIKYLTGSNSNNNKKNQRVHMYLCVACAFDLGAGGPCGTAA